jgi:hypothetical protein
MKNIVTMPTPGNALALDNLETALSAGSIESGQGSTTDPILRLRRDGAWIYGSDSVDVEDGSQWAFHPLTFQHGYICWGPDADLLGEIMVPLGQPRPAKSDLPDHGFAWLDQFSVMGMCVAGEDKGQQVIYKPSSVGGRRAISTLMAAIQGRIRTEGTDGAIVPVCKLKASAYQHKKFGQIFNPIIEIVGWSQLEEAGAPVEGEEEPAAEAPRKRRTRKQ